MPTDPSEAQQKLRDVEQQLEELERQHLAIKRAATTWPRFWLKVGGLGVCVGADGVCVWGCVWFVCGQVCVVLAAGGGV